MSDHVGQMVHFTPGGGICYPATTTTIGQYQARNLAVHDPDNEETEYYNSVEWDGDMPRGTWHHIGEGNCSDDPQGDEE